MNKKNTAVKRIFDVLFSTAVIVLGAIPLYLPVALVVALTGNAPVIFSQKRNGKNGKVFTCYKFRTLKKNSRRDTVENNLATASVDTYEYIPLGKFLRATGLDELPQFINVLKGDMSVVGPRPMMIEENEYFAQRIPDYERRHEVKPGITGLAQVDGYKGKIASLQFMKERVAKDIEYVDNNSLKGDIRIIGRTIKDMVKQI